MALARGLSLYCYTLNGQGGSLALAEYGAVVENLLLTQNAPGGYGTLTALLKLKDARLPRPELQLFARVALIDPTLPSPDMCVFLGEMSDPEQGMDQHSGEYVKITALGLGAALRDDPDTRSYSNKTPLQIVQDQFTYSRSIAGLGTVARTNTLIIDQDTSACFPDNPGVSLSPSYAGRNMEDVVADVAKQAANGTALEYVWGVWAHPQHRDALGFPTGQLLIHQRDTSTVGYRALDGDLEGWRITPSSERAYNVVEIGYNDPGQSPAVGSKFGIDTRLATNGGQGTAPFRFRHYLRDLAGIQTVTAAVAQNIATSYVTQLENPPNRVEITLNNVRDAQGRSIPLWQAFADRNIFIPALAPRGLTGLPTGPTAGVNLFYIRSIRYTEDQTGKQQLVLQCDNFADHLEIAVARLQLQADILARIGGKQTGPVQAAGAPVYGTAGSSQQASGAGQVVGAWTDYPGAQVLTNAPTSIHPISAVEQINAGSPGFSNISASGFTMWWTSGAAGETSLYEKYNTVGN